MNLDGNPVHLEDEAIFLLAKQPSFPHPLAFNSPLHPSRSDFLPGSLLAFLLYLFFKAESKTKENIPVECPEAVMNIITYHSPLIHLRIIRIFSHISSSQ